MTGEAQTMLGTLAVWAGVALLVLWAFRRPGTPMFSGPRWQVQQVPLWVWMAGGAFAGAGKWQGTWLLYGILGPIMALVFVAVLVQVRRHEQRSASTTARTPAMRS
jgi:O-antigen/teichoic acid export membrane protein